MLTSVEDMVVDYYKNDGLLSMASTDSTWSAPLHAAEEASLHFCHFSSQGHFEREC